MTDQEKIIAIYVLMGFVGVGLVCMIGLVIQLADFLKNGSSLKDKKQ